MRHVVYLENFYSSNRRRRTRPDNHHHNNCLCSRVVVNGSLIGYCWILLCFSSLDLLFTSKTESFAFQLSPSVFRKRNNDYCFDNDIFCGSSIKSKQKMWKISLSSSARSSKEEQQLVQQQQIMEDVRNPKDLTTVAEEELPVEEKHSTAGDDESIIFQEWFAQYKYLMSHIMVQRRALDGYQLKNKKKSKNGILSQSEIQAVQTYLLLPPTNKGLDQSKSNSGDDKRTNTDCSDRFSYREQLLNEKTLFWHGKRQPNNGLHDKLNPDIKTGGSSMVTKSDYIANFTNPEIQADYASFCLSYIADVCAKQQLPGPCVIAWYKLKECCIRPRENSVSTYMYVFSLQPSSQILPNYDQKKNLLHGATNNIDPSNALQQQREHIISDTCLEVATFHDMLFEPNEKTVTLRIKALISKGDAEAAEEVLSSVPNKEDVRVNNKKDNKRKAGKEASAKSDWKRLRTFLPILSYYCNDTESTAAESSSIVAYKDHSIGSKYVVDGNNAQKTLSALRLFRQMRVSEGVHLDAETYAMLISALARRGCFSRDLEYEIEEERTLMDGTNQEKASNEHRAGTALMNYVFSQMADDILELDEESAKNIYDGFVMGFAKENVPLADAAKEVPPLSAATLPHGLLVGRVSVDQATSVCPGTGAKLQLFALSESQREQVHSSLLEMAAQQHEEYGEKLLARRQQGIRRGKNKEAITASDCDSKDKAEDVSTTKNDLEDTGRDGQYAYLELLKFSEWLREESARLPEEEGQNCTGLNLDNQQRPFTAIVDGPNIAYFGHGDVHYSQVQIVVDALERMGENPLVVMPQKYVTDKFWLALGFPQALSTEDKCIRDQLLAKKQMYVVPTSCLDDYYWMLASVAYTSEECNSPQMPAVCFPGGWRPLIITNDQMRDHRLSLLEPRSFRRWTSCHIVNYDIEPYQEDEWQERKVTFIPADSFSREIQRNNIDETRIFGDRAQQSTTHKISAWHIPVSEWDASDRFCISVFD